ncbi:MAG: DnaJ domain-containing protein [Clostridia bacterium]|nr:DnaJ domain-containing protein [Clostridia bacterium]
MKNYYEILEVDKNASDEIIKVAYKALVKKYHPDLKEGTSKINAEEKIKQINEAYDILSNPEKKYKYDQNLINESISKEQYEIVLNENMNLKRELNVYRNNIYQNYRNNNKYTKENYNTNYNNNKQSNTYKEQNSNINNNNFKENISERLKTLLAICLTFLIIFLLYNIPFIKDLFSSFLGSNYIFLIVIIIIAYIYFFRNKQ